MKPDDALWTTAALRTFFGATLLAAPGLTGRAWVGPEARQPVPRALSRMAGIRDVAVGVGTLDALERGGDARRWALIGAAVDATDAVVIGVMAVRLRRIRPLLAAASAATAAVIGFRLHSRGV